MTPGSAELFAEILIGYAFNIPNLVHCMRFTLATLFLAFCVNNALAEGTSVRLEVGTSDVDLQNLGPNNGASSSTASGLILSQQIVPNLSVEVGYRDLGNFDTRQRFVRQDKLKASLVDLGLSYRWTLEWLNRGVYLMGRLGVGFFDVRGTESPGIVARAPETRTFKERGNEFYYGVGVGFAVTESVDLGLHFTNYQAVSQFTPNTFTTVQGAVSGVTRKEDIDLPVLAASLSWKF